MNGGLFDSRRINAVSHAAQPDSPRNSPALELATGVSRLLNKHVEIFGTMHNSLGGLNIRDVALGDLQFDLRLGGSGSVKCNVDGVVDGVFISHSRSLLPPEPERHRIDNPRDCKCLSTRCGAPTPRSSEGCGVVGCGRPSASRKFAPGAVTATWAFVIGVARSRTGHRRPRGRLQRAT